jgi:hypothetical protein
MDVCQKRLGKINGIVIVVRRAKKREKDRIKDILKKTLELSFAKM